MDMARLREASLGDRRFLHELIALFLEDTPRQLTALRESIEEADLSALHRGAHRLKGAGTNLGAQVFAELCLKLEQLGKQGNLKEAPAVFHDLQEEYARLQDFLNGL